MRRAKKLIARLLCVVLVIGLMAPLSGCNKKGKRGEGAIANLADASSAKDATFKKSSDITLDFLPDYIISNGTDVIYYVCSYESSDYEDQTGVDTEEVTEDTSETDSEPATEEAPATEETSESEESEEDGETEEPTDEENTQLSTPGYVLKYAIGDKEGNIYKTGKYIAGKGSRSAALAFVDASKNIRVVESVYDTEESYGTGVFLLTVSADGAETNRAKLDGFDTISTDSVAYFTDGSVALVGDDAVIKFDANGKKNGAVEITSGAYINSIVANAAGDVYTTEYGGSGLVAKKVDFVSGQFVGSVNLTGYGILLAGDGYDFYLKNNMAIYGYNFADGKETMIMNFLDSDMQGSFVNSICTIDPKNFLFSTNSMEGSEEGVSLYTKVNPEDVKEKKIIVLGGLYLGYSDVNAMVMKFNKSNEEYRIRTFDYSVYNSSEDPTAAEKQLRNDILTNCGPDIILTNDLSDTNVYADKKVFADLYPIMQKNGVNKDDFLPNVLDAGSKDGKLYMFIPKFTVYCMITKEANLKGKKGLSFKDFATLEQQYNCVGSAVPYTVRADLIQNVMYNNSDEFYDVASGTCKFNTQGFKDLLEWAKNYPDDFDKAYEKFEHIDESELFPRNAIVAENMNLSSFRAFNREELGKVHDRAALIGYPSMEGEKAGVIIPEVSIAIANNTAHQDACFEFLKLFMEDSYQIGTMEEDSYTYNFPSKKAAFDRLGEISMEDPFYFEDGKKTYYKESVYTPQGQKEIEPISQERLDYVKNFIYSCNTLRSGNESIISLVNEEASAYFNNQKSLDDVAGVVQSRVEIYVRENQ